MNRNLKVLDLSYNNFSGEAVREMAAVFEINRNLEFVGLAKNNLTSEDVMPLLKCFGRAVFPTEKVAQHQQELKNREAIIEKNKKLKASKKPEEPVPVLDNLESEVTRDETGAETTTWYLLKNPQFKHLNLCLNKIGDDVLEKVDELLSNSSDDFGITLAGNVLNPARVKEIHSKMEKLHKKRHADALKTDPTAQLIEDVAQKRLAF
jgi:Ran GTPase-activating protein (RanGAP) involved in mRNA processing and transport